MSTTDERSQFVSLSLTPSPQPTKQPRLPRYLVGFSTKAYFDLPRTVSYLQHFLSALPSLDKTDSGNDNNNQSNDIATFILPSYPFIPIVAGLISSHYHPSSSPPQSTGEIESRNRSSALTIWYGAQNTHPHPTGSCTGEVPPLLLRQLGCTLVCLGHAERRAAPFFETDEVVAKKAVEVVRQGMVPLVCIGEKERPSPGSDKGLADAMRFVTEQVSEVLAVLAEDLPGPSTNYNVVFAYEPIWAIGAKEPAGKEHVCAVVRGMKGPVRRTGWRGDVRWLYGGSAGPGVWEGLKEQCDGLFLGRFAHEPERFLDVIKEVRGS